MIQKILSTPSSDTIYRIQYAQITNKHLIVKESYDNILSLCLSEYAIRKNSIQNPPLQLNRGLQCFPAVIILQVTISLDCAIAGNL